MADSRLCLDTSALISFLKGREPGASAVEVAVRTSTCYVTAITVYELLFGVARASRQIGEEQLLSAMQVLPFDEKVARRAAALHDELIRMNAEIGIKDVLIAATCLEHQLPILTLNEKHFHRVAGLTVLSPAELVN
jgi:tRNA(fMet)-specific endonuclease VapC